MYENMVEVHLNDAVLINDIQLKLPFCSQLIKKFLNKIFYAISFKRKHNTTLLFLILLSCPQALKIF